MPHVSIIYPAITIIAENPIIIFGRKKNEKEIDLHNISYPVGLMHHIPN
jgi:hypothetical protein